jgi:hypothetical protein
MAENKWIFSICNLEEEAGRHAFDGKLGKQDKKPRKTAAFFNLYKIRSPRKVTGKAPEQRHRFVGLLEIR